MEVLVVYAALPLACKPDPEFPLQLKRLGLGKAFLIQG